MAVVCRSYTAEHEARGAVEALLAAGVPGSGIRVLMGEPERDAGTEPQGHFADPPGDADHVKDYAGREHAEGSGMGTYAGSADEQRMGSYADADRDVVSDFPEGVHRQRVAGHGKLHRMFLDAGLDHDVAKRELESLHSGRIFVLAEGSEEQVSAALGGA